MVASFNQVSLQGKSLHQNNSSTDSTKNTNRSETFLNQNNSRVNYLHGFDIRNFIDKLSPTNRKNRYECPECGGDNLTIDPDTGAYQCWNYEGDKQHLADIRNAIAPLDKSGNVLRSTPKRQSKPSKPLSRPAPIPDAPIKLARFTPTDIIKTGSSETRYPYGEGKIMIRIAKGEGKICYPITDGIKGKKETWSAYRESEVLQYGAGQWVLGVEGEKCVEAARELGILAFTMQASDWGHEPNGALFAAIKRFKQGGIAGIIYFPDSDDTGKKKAEKVQLACNYAQLPCIVINPLELDSKAIEGWDIANWVSDSVLSGEEIVAQLEGLADKQRDRVQNIKTDKDDENFKLLQNNFNPDAGQFGDTQEEPCKHKLQLLKVKKKVGNKLKFNLMTQQVEFGGEPLDLDDIYLFLAEEFNIQISKGNAPDIILKIAKANSYHPVKDYLLANYEANKNIDLSIVNDISTRYFGTTEDIYNVMMRKTLIGAVARVLDPGCKFDTATILQGDQDIKKSTFWATLAGKNWFDDTFDDIENKDDLSKLTRYWCVEFAEFENVTTKKAAGAVKKFLSTQSDRYRVPYGRSVKEFPRTSFIVGSVNPVGILNDPTGDRRFWVIPVRKDRFNQIDIKRLQRERDQLWAAAVHLYNSGEIFYLTDAEKVLANESNKDFQIQDSWESYISAYLIGKDFVTVGEVLTDALEIDKGRQDRTAQSRVTGILRRHGWEQTKKRIGGKELRGWGLKSTVSPVSQPLSQAETDSQQRLQEITKNDCLTTVSTTVSAITQSQQGLHQLETDETLKSPKLLIFDSNGNRHDKLENGYSEKNKSLSDSTVSTVSSAEISSQQDIETETLVRHYNPLSHPVESPKHTHRNALSRETVPQPDQVEQFSVGDIVAAKDLYEVKYNWRGTVEAVSDDGLQVTVFWPEREGKPGICNEKHEASYLRVVEYASPDF